MSDIALIAPGTIFQTLILCLSENKKVPLPVSQSWVFELWLEILLCTNAFVASIIAVYKQLTQLDIIWYILEQSIAHGIHSLTLNMVVLIW